MNWLSALEILEPFQTLVVGIVGFSGVIFTLWFNARSAKIHQMREKSLRADAVAALVKAELELLLGAMLLAAMAEEPEVGESTKFPKLKVTYLPNVVDELGLLGSDLTKKVIRAFMTIENTMAKVSLFAQSFEAEYLTVSRENVDLVSKVYESHIEPLKEALSALEARKSTS